MRRSWSTVLIASLIIAVAGGMTIHTLTDGELKTPACVDC
jgi:hypothetical protein